MNDGRMMMYVPNSHHATTTAMYDDDDYGNEVTAMGKKLHSKGKKLL